MAERMRRELAGELSEPHRRLERSLDRCDRRAVPTPGRFRGSRFHNRQPGHLAEPGPHRPSARPGGPDFDDGVGMEVAGLEQNAGAVEERLPGTADQPTVENRDE